MNLCDLTVTFNNLYVGKCVWKLRLIFLPSSKKISGSQLVFVQDPQLQQTFQNFSKMAFSKTSELAWLKNARQNVHIQAQQQHMLNVNLNSRAIKVEFFKRVLFSKKKYYCRILFSKSRIPRPPYLFYGLSLFFRYFIMEICKVIFVHISIYFIS